VTLFDDQPSSPVSPARSAQSRRRSAGWLSLAIAFVLLGVLALWPSPWVIEQPGPVFNTLGTVQHDEKDVPMIDIQGAETYDTAGSLDMLTVQVNGTPDQRPSWFEVAMSWFDPSRAVVPLEAVYPPGVTTEQRSEQNATLMVDSQQDAVAAALSELGYTYPQHLAVGSVAKGSPAENVLKVDDDLVSVNGETVDDLESVRTAISANGADKPASIDIVRGGVPMTIEVTPIEQKDAAGETQTVIGIGTRMVYDFPIDVTIQLDNVGGPSAGMMFALGIIDKLTPGELNGGADVAGTGTITESGEVGAIGGIRQKLFAARDDGATIFLAPSANCDEVVGHVPDGIRVFSVSTLNDSMAVLDAVREKGDLDALPTCETAAAAPTG
jgi:PDZ domain-containing protein